MTASQPAGPTVLVVQAHPDDADIACGGTVARWVMDGWRVCYVCVTSGEAGRSNPPVDAGTLGTMREAEQEAAAAILGVAAVHSLRFPDGRVEDSAALRAALVAQIAREQPTRLLTHDPDGGGEQHPDHQAVGAVVMAVWGQLAATARPELYLFHADQPTIAVDISATLEQKLAAVAAHRSQRSLGEAPQERLRAGAVETGRRWGLPLAEQFRRLA